jgi:hypothetical protein
VASRCLPAGADIKPPHAAAVKRRGRESWGKGGMDPASHLSSVPYSSRNCDNDIPGWNWDPGHRHEIGIGTCVPG